MKYLKYWLIFCLIFNEIVINLFGDLSQLAGITFLLQSGFLDRKNSGTKVLSPGNDTESCVTKNDELSDAVPGFTNQLILPG